MMTMTVDDDKIMTIIQMQVHMVSNKKELKHRKYGKIAAPKKQTHNI